MILDPYGRPVEAQMSDPIDGYTPGIGDGVTPELRGAIAAEVERVKQIRADEAAGAATRCSEWAKGVELDGYVNEVSGIGNYLYDKTKGGAEGPMRMTLDRFSSIQAEVRVRGTDLGARIVSVIPDEMTREGWDLQVQPTEQEDLANRDPRLAMDAALRNPRRAAAGWRRSAVSQYAAMERDRMRARGFAARWDAIAAGLEQATAATAPPPPPGPLPHLSEDGIELAEAMTSKMEDLDLLGAVNQALRYERAYGGGAILIGADDGEEDLTKPLDETKIRSLRHLTPYFGGWDGEVVAWRWYTDPRRPNYGKPEIYQLRNLGIPLARTPAPGETNPPTTYVPTGPTGGLLFYIHESRLIIFPGEAASRRARVEMRGWGDSIFTRVDDRLSQFEQAWSGLAILLQEFSIQTLKMKGLAQLLTSNDPKKKGAILERARMLAFTNSIARTRLIDDQEEFTRVTATLTGAPELMSQFLLLIAGVCDMPVSLLVGQVKGGLGDAGNTDIRFFYDRIRSLIQRRLLPRLRRLYRIAWLAKDSPTKGVEPERWSLVPRELWQMSPTEKAGLRKTYAEIDQININAGIYSADEAAASRYGGPEFGENIVLDLEGRKEMAAMYERQPPRPRPEATAPEPGVTPGTPDGPRVAPANSTPIIGVTAPTQPTTIPPMVAVPVDPITADPTGTPSVIGQTGKVPKRDSQCPKRKGRRDEWSEEDHPRDESGRFGEGGGGGSASKEPTMENMWDAMAETNYHHFGLRIVPDDDDAEEGDELDPSRVWNEGEPTDEYLPGTSAIELKAEVGEDYIDLQQRDFDKAIRQVKGYVGGKLLLVASDLSQGGQDEGEVILKNAVVVAVYKRPK